MAGRTEANGKLGRVCVMVGCGRRVRLGEVVCAGHRRAPEALALRREVAGMAAYLDRVAEEDPAKAADTLRRFERRAERGEFDGIGKLRRQVEEVRAEAGAEVARRIAEARVAIVRAIVEEGDPSRMAGEVVRRAGDVVRGT